MEPGMSAKHDASWASPAWLESHQLSDSRFGRAYNALGDERRALLKGVIARHFALHRPLGALETGIESRHDLLSLRRHTAPVPFALLLTESQFDAPAFFLSALMPALCARVPQVLCCRLGSRAAAPDSLLTSCELSGQEQLAALGPVLVQRLLLECAASGEPGIVLYPDTFSFRRLLCRKPLAEMLAASSLRLFPLRLPRRAGLWRDAWHQFRSESLELLYGGLRFTPGGVAPEAGGSVETDPSAWKRFSASSFDLLLTPDARAGQGRAEVAVSEACLGMWRWHGLSPDVFLRQRTAFGPVS